MDSIVFSLPFPSLDHLSETFPGSIFFLEDMITFFNLEEGEGYEWTWELADDIGEFAISSMGSLGCCDLVIKSISSSRNTDET